MPENKIVLSVVGDFGNPSGSGLSRIVLDDVRNGSALTAGMAEAIGIALHGALVTAQLTGTALGDSALTSKLPAFVNKPANSVNVDRLLVVDWRTVSDSTVRRVTIPGVPVSSTSLEFVDNGERLNDAGKAAVAAALTAFFGLTDPEVVVVLRGKVLQKS